MMLVRKLQHIAPPHILAERMRAHPDYPNNSELKSHAVALTALNYKTPVRIMLGTWARARRYWCQLTGEVFSMTPEEILKRAREIENSDTSQGSERVLAKEVIRLRGLDIASLQRIQYNGWLKVMADTVRDALLKMEKL